MVLELIFLESFTFKFGAFFNWFFNVMLLQYMGCSAAGIAIKWGLFAGFWHVSLTLHFWFEFLNSLRRGTGYTDQCYGPQS